VVSPEQLRDVVEANLDAPAFLIKMEPEIIQPELKLKSLFGLVKAPRDIQYNTSTVIVDLKPNEDEILASLKQKTRYNVRLAEKKGVQVEAVEATETNFRKMYELMQATQKRAGFYLRDYAYFHDFWMRHAEAKRGQLFFASFEGKILAGDFVTYAGTKGLYKDGGSIREHSELQAPYLLQWEVIRWLKAQGVTEYDLHGTPPADQIDNPSHPLAGLARFKTGFNPVITEFVGVWDQPLDAAKYAKWNKYGERVAAGYARRVKKELFY
jgi:lipid II:glycine glycyltransferase (peptidoglycan interpeptide bridge formation enzyme)